MQKNLYLYTNNEKQTDLNLSLPTKEVKSYFKMFDLIVLSVEM